MDLVDEARDEHSGRDDVDRYKHSNSDHELLENDALPLLPPVDHEPPDLEQTDEPDEEEEGSDEQEDREGDDQPKEEGEERGVCVRPNDEARG